MAGSDQEREGELRRLRERIAELEATLEEHETALDALRSGEESLAEEYINSLPGLFFVVDGHRLVRWNRNQQSVTGYSDEEMRDRPAIEFFAEEDREYVAERMLAVVMHGEAEMEADVMTRDGRGIPYHFTGVLREFDGRPHLVGMGVDISARREAEREKEQLEDQVRHGQKMEAIGRLAAGVAHDFNNALCIIMGNVQMAQRDLSREEQVSRSFGAIMKASQRAADLTRQLLAFSRKQIIDPKVIDPARLMEDLRPMLDRLIGEDITLQTRCDDSPGKIRFDEGQFQQIVFNLAINARDAMPDGGELLIEARNAPGGDGAGEKVVLRVSDTGCGMSVEVREQIFEPFYTTKELGRGTGLGLSTVHAIMEQNGGRIDVQSEPGNGTVFTLEFPTVDGEAQASLRAEEARFPRGDETVLVVEDEEMVRDLTVQLLTSLGYTVLHAGTGGKALALSRQHAGRIELLITDVIMPHMNGRELADQLTEQRPGLKVLYASGYSEDVIASHGVLDEGVELVAKPYSLDQLAVRVRDVLDRP